jgi:hypothetical protein
MAIFLSPPWVDNGILPSLPLQQNKPWHKYSFIFSMHNASSISLLLHHQGASGPIETELLFLM